MNERPLSPVHRDPVEGYGAGRRHISPMALT